MPSGFGGAVPPPDPMRYARMATIFTGPFFTPRAFSAAPVPRPPHPTRANWMVLFSAAWTCGRVRPARVDTPAMRLLLVRNWRRDVASSLIALLPHGQVTPFHGRRGMGGNLNRWPA